MREQSNASIDEDTVYDDENENGDDTPDPFADHIGPDLNGLRSSTNGDKWKRVSNVVTEARTVKPKKTETFDERLKRKMGMAPDWTEEEAKAKKEKALSSFEDRLKKKMGESR